MKKADRLSFATFVQMKIGHSYFKSYLYRLPKYGDKKCRGFYTKDQTPEHLLTACQFFKEEQKAVKDQLKKANLPLTAKSLFSTNEGIKATLAFLKETKVATRKWLLGEENSEDETGGEMDLKGG